MALNKYAGLRVSIEGHFENSSRSYEYFLHEKIIPIFINYLLSEMDYPHLSLDDFEKDIFYTYINTPYGKNKKFYFTNIHLLGTYGFKVRDTKATKFINKVFEGYDDLSLSKLYPKGAHLTDEDVERLFGEDFGKNKKEDSVAVFKFDSDSKLNVGGDIGMMKIDNTEKRGFNIPGLKNVGKQLNNVFAFSIITKKIAIKMGDSFFSFDKDTKQITDETSFAMEVPFPAMIFPEKMSKLKSGDLVIRDNKIVFVVDVDKEGKTYTYIGSEGKIETAAKVSNVLMKEMDFVEKVVNPLADAFDSSEDDELFDNPMMMMALMGNGGNIFGGGNGGNNDIMSMLMLSKMMKK